MRFLPGFRTAHATVLTISFFSKSMVSLKFHICVNSLRMPSISALISRLKKKLGTVKI
jgi:hypothetical protein